MKQVAIMGGTFDPVHLGHMSFARDVLDGTDVTEVVFMPAKLQPFKLDVQMSSFEDRFAMLEIACRQVPGTSVSRLEYDLPGVSYTYRTLEEYRARYLNNQGGEDDLSAPALYFVTGSDTYTKLDTWSAPEKLLSENAFIVGVRPGYPDSEIMEKMVEYRAKFGTKTILIHNTPVDLSATEIREDVAMGRSIEGKVAPEVAEYIYNHGLYR